MAKLIGTMDHLIYGASQPNYVIEYDGCWYYGSSTVWYEVGGVRQGTMMESALYTIFCQCEFQVKAGQHPNLKHYTVAEIYNMYQEYKRNRPLEDKINDSSVSFWLIVAAIVGMLIVMACT